MANKVSGDCSNSSFSVVHTARLSKSSHYTTSRLVPGVLEPPCGSRYMSGRIQEGQALKDFWPGGIPDEPVCSPLSVLLWPESGQFTALLFSC